VSNEVPPPTATRWAPLLRPLRFPFAVFRMKGYKGYILRRLMAFVPLLFGISLVTFFLIRLLPGDPARVLAGSTPYEEAIEAIRQRMGLDQPITTQYVIYVRNLLQGDLGDSWFTGRPVAVDLRDRAPATLELITYGLLFAIILGLFLGIVGALSSGGIVDRVAQFYGFLAGAIPDFWLALLVILFLFHHWQIIPPPIGRFPLTMVEPNQVTGMLTVDSLIAGDFAAFRASVKQLAAPVLTLGLLTAAPITRMTRSTMHDILEGDFIRFGRACGLSNGKIARNAFRSILPPVVTLIGFLYAFLIGGAVLIETVFSWNGVGQYAVQSVVNKDYAPVQAFVLIAGVFSLFVYLVVDLIYMMVDPRVRL
jgi:ABC-type dipeptide/oligopeptide/nickel transport system permease component